MTEPKYIVVVGASAGGLNSIIELTAQLNDKIDAAVFIVLHITQITSPELLVQRFENNSSFSCKLAEDGEKIQRGHIYVAVPDRHLLIKNRTVLVGRGSPENRWRPSIDILFRSAAAAYGGRVIGIILSGMMEDGTAGMLAIKKSGGTLIAQDPEEAEYPDMPQSVLNNMKVDYCVPLDAMGAILLEKSKDGKENFAFAPPEVIAEANIAERVAIDIDKVSELGDKSVFSCPDCGGGLWEIKEEDVTRYRCHIGHMYNQKELELRQKQALENTMWIALRMMEERRNLLRKMSEEERGKGWARSADHKLERAVDLEAHITRLKEILFQVEA
jgi:two-component system, chemotaxis family, protein-glutamate methylesterase/glutaminase